MNSKRKPTWVAAATLFLATLIIVLLFWRGVVYWLDKPRLNTVSATQFIRVEPGSSLQAVGEALAVKQMLASPSLFPWIARFTGKDQHIQAGEYALEPGMSLRQLLANMANGHVVQHKFTLVEGQTFADMRRALDNAPSLKHETTKLSSAELMAQLGFSGEAPEGQFYPTTYIYTSHNTDRQILTHSHAMMHKTLHQLWEARDEHLPYHCVNDALIVASLLERESADPQERFKIAAVIKNRLRRHMRLQIDPTVFYGLGRHGGHLTHEEVHSYSPYNTYVIRGLPPTPIAMPSAQSLYAALHPAAIDALYFVADRQGHHVFSRTLKAHDQAIRMALAH